MLFSQSLDGEEAIILDQVSVQVNAAAEVMSQAVPQVRVLDMYSLSAVSVHQGTDLRTYVVPSIYLSHIEPITIYCR